VHLIHYLETFCERCGNDLVQRHDLNDTARLAVEAILAEQPAP
jgi:hypothetical protein